MRQAGLLGSDTEVPCADGRMRRYVNLDNAASTSAMAEVSKAVERFMPWYSSVHSRSDELAAYGPRARYERVPERDEYRALAATSAAAA